MHAASNPADTPLHCNPSSFHGRKWFRAKNPWQSKRGPVQLPLMFPKVILIGICLVMLTMGLWQLLGPGSLPVQPFPNQFGFYPIDYYSLQCGISSLYSLQEGRSAHWLQRQYFFQISLSRNSTFSVNFIFPSYPVKVQHRSPWQHGSRPKQPDWSFAVIAVLWAQTVLFFRSSYFCRMPPTGKEAP